MRSLRVLDAEKVAAYPLPLWHQRDLVGPVAQISGAINTAGSAGNTSQSMMEFLRACDQPPFQPPAAMKHHIGADCTAARANWTVSHIACPYDTLAAHTPDERIGKPVKAAPLARHLACAHIFRRPEKRARPVSYHIGTVNVPICHRLRRGALSCASTTSNQRLGQRLAHTRPMVTGAMAPPA